MDPRPGGSFRVDIRAAEGATCESSYPEILVPERIVFSGSRTAGGRAAA
jgi:hypothetical protein